MAIRAITADEARDEIRRLERAYGRSFLEKSLHRVGLRWRELTAPNAAERIANGQIKIDAREKPLHWTTELAMQAGDD